MLSIFLPVVLILLLLGGFVPTRNTPQGAWYHGYGFGVWPGGALIGTLLVVVLIAIAAGKL